MQTRYWLCYNIHTARHLLTRERYFLPAVFLLANFLERDFLIGGRFYENSVLPSRDIRYKKMAVDYDVALLGWQSTFSSVGQYEDNSRNLTKKVRLQKGRRIERMEQSRWSKSPGESMKNEASSDKGKEMHADQLFSVLAPGNNDQQPMGNDANPPPAVSEISG